MSHKKSVLHHYAIGLVRVVLPLQKPQVWTIQNNMKVEYKSRDIIEIKDSFLAIKGGSID